MQGGLGAARLVLTTQCGVHAWCVCVCVCVDMMFLCFLLTMIIVLESVHIYIHQSDYMMSGSTKKVGNMTRYPNKVLLFKTTSNHMATFF